MHMLWVARTHGSDNASRDRRPSPPSSPLPAPADAARYKLAQLVQYLPLPVIGGYLSFVVSREGLLPGLGGSLPLHR